MFERYTQAARLTIFRARYVASRIGNLEIEPEHLLLGVLTDKTLASRFLGSPWAAETVWKRVEQRKPILDKVPGTGEIPLNKASKRSLNLAAEEAELHSSRQIGTEHLLLGLLREEQSLAAEILRELGVHLESTRAELSRMPHDDSKQEEFVRERGSLPADVVEQETRFKSIKARLMDALSNADFEKARAVKDEGGRNVTSWFCFIVNTDFQTGFGFGLVNGVTIEVNLGAQRTLCRFRDRAQHRKADDGGTVGYRTKIRLPESLLATFTF